ncbi:hypothetical protein JCM13664_08300 [Methylothermus subterraneus]
MAWSDEAARQQFLRRILPALAICVAYFTFAKGFLEENTRKAEEKWRGLVEKGISQEALAALAQRMERLDADLAAREAKKQRFVQEVAQVVGGLDPVQGEADFNRLIEHLHQLLGAHQLELLAEREAAQTLERATAAVSEFRQLLTQGGLGDKLPARAWQLEFLGRYADVYRALEALARDPRVILVVSLTMKPPPDDSDPRMLWTLTVWI